ncbi:MAG: ferrochelatase [Bacteroidales bacterium]|nr:ferrochelatase [Bacteroidales bacterium]
MKKKAVLLVNVGTPDAPVVKDVRRYLTQFLNDARVIDIPWLFRKLLVNLIIIPFRVKKSTALYRRLWTPEGSPLLIYLESLAAKLQQLQEDDTEVLGVMSYGKPSLSGALKRIEKENFQEVIVFPLYPQYASSTTGSVFENIMSRMKRWEVFPGIRFIGQYYDHPAFLEAYARRIRPYRPEKYDHIVFSYHGLPLRQINKVHPEVSADECNCEKECHLMVIYVIKQPVTKQHVYWSTSFLLKKGDTVFPSSHACPKTG